MRNISGLLSFFVFSALVIASPGVQAVGAASWANLFTGQAKPEAKKTTPSKAAPAKESTAETPKVTTIPIHRAGSSPRNIIHLPEGYWSYWISEEKKGFHICPHWRYIVGLSCSGKSCDDRSMRCSTKTILPAKKDDSVQIEVTHFVSEEGMGIAECRLGWYAIGLECKGDLCDDQRLMCVKPRLKKTVKKTTGRSGHSCRWTSKVSSGTTRTAATTLGTARKRVGLKPMVNKASISSEICMVPISAAYADPVLPATTMAVMIGPSSDTMASATREAT